MQTVGVLLCVGQIKQAPLVKTTKSEVVLQFTCSFLQQVCVIVSNTELLWGLIKHRMNRTWVISTRFSIAQSRSIQPPTFILT